MRLGSTSGRGGRAGAPPRPPAPPAPPPPGGVAAATASARALPHRTPSEPGATASPKSADEIPRIELRPLVVDGFLDAVVALPDRAHPLPLVVAAHGAGGDPEWTCRSWAERVRGQRIVLCPRGKALSKRKNWGYYYPDHYALGAEVLAAVSALERELGARVAPGGALYTGYSQGASMGALFVAEHGARFPALILTEGGTSEWSLASARKYSKSGGRRVLFVCGNTGCKRRAEKSAALLEKAGVSARVEHVPGGGHTDEGAVGERLDATYRWALAEGE